MSDRQRKAYELRMAGYKYREIADFWDADGPLYASAGAAWNAVQAYMRETAQGDTVGEQRRVEMDRMDALQTAVWERAMLGDVDSVKLVLAIMKERGRLLGLEKLQAPEKEADALDELAQRRERSG